MDVEDERKEEELERSDCTIPGPVPMAVLRRTVLNQAPHEEEEIENYMAWQAKDEQVLHLEKMATERVFGRELKAWDVHTDKNRWWVITNPTNLYSQEHFPSLDYTLSFHIGVTARVMARDSKTAPGEGAERLVSAWRRWEQAAEALDQADEAEAFQAVGMRCRECLLAFIREVGSPALLPDGQDAPKGADFIHWSEVVANTVAQGSSAKEARGYLKSLAKSTWQLVNGLTHAGNAVRFDGQMAVDATQNTLAAFGTALMRYERGAPDRCPQCGSYRLASVYELGLDLDPPYVALCEACGWNSYKGG